MTDREGRSPVVSMSGVRHRWAPTDAFELRIDSFSIDPGSQTAVVGPSGAGKSTLLSVVAGVIRPQLGSVLVLGEELTALPGVRRDRFRAENIGIVFQQFNLLPFARVLDNVLLPLSFAPQRRARARAAGAGDPRREAVRLLAALDVPEDLLRKPAHTLSVGQQQRVAVARALIGAPPILLADEPTSALDAVRRDAFLDLVFSEADRAGSTIVFVTHDAEVAARFERRIVLAERTGGDA